MSDARAIVLDESVRAAAVELAEAVDGFEAHGAHMDEDCDGCRPVYAALAAYREAKRRAEET